MSILVCPRSLLMASQMIQMMKSQMHLVKRFEMSTVMYKIWKWPREHDGLTIKENIGNVATKNDELSLALITIKNPPSSRGSPCITMSGFTSRRDGLNYTNRIRKVDPKLSSRSTKERRSLFRRESNSARVSGAFQVHSPVHPPAFALDRCIREEGTELSDISARLDELHNGKEAAASADKVNAKFDDVKTIYHMRQTLRCNFSPVNGNFLDTSWITSHLVVLFIPSFIACMYGSNHP